MDDEKLLSNLVAAAVVAHGERLKRPQDEKKLKKAEEEYARLKKTALERMKRYDGITDEDIVRHRFCKKNVRKDVTVLAAEVGISRAEYVAAIERSLGRKDENSKGMESKD